MSIVITTCCSAPWMQKGLEGSWGEAKLLHGHLLHQPHLLWQITWHTWVLSKDCGHHPPEVQSTAMNTQRFHSPAAFRKQSWVMMDQSSECTESQAGNDARGYNSGFRHRQVSEMSHWQGKAAQSTDRTAVQSMCAEIQQRDQHRNLY